ncbi:hypothetical protein BJF78_01575 [Pseudonocardia sp. CNS-139]|nr:hypothetical protein BJF78_01575 [Pseudonocardia sp. CNS-139]
MWVWIVIAAGVVAVAAAVIIVVLLRGRRTTPVPAVAASPQWGARPPDRWAPQARVNAQNAQNAQWMPPPRPQQPAPQANAGAPTVAVTPDGVVCGRCGQRSATGIRFCSGCGSPLV